MACSVYDESLLAIGQAGSAGNASAGDGAGGSGSAAGSTPAPQAGTGTAGVTSGGNGGSGGGGSGGDAKGGGGGSVSPTMAGAAGEDSVGGGPEYELIDDMEDDNSVVLTGTGRDGYWQTEKDTTPGAMLVPPAGGGFVMTALTGADSREGSSFAAGMHVTGFTNSVWGALMVVSMRTTGESIDASAFCGLHFWAKRGTGNATLVLKVVDKHSSPLGELCSLEDGNCYDDFHITVPVTTEWSDHMVRFSDLVQYGTGYQSPTGELDAAAIHGIAFAIDEAADFELLVDDLAFVRSGSCAP